MESYYSYFTLKNIDEINCLEYTLWEKSPLLLKYLKRVIKHSFLLDYFSSAGGKVILG